MKPKLLDLVRNRIRLMGYSLSTEKTYTGWIRKYIVWSDLRYPSEPDESNLRSWLEHLVNNVNVDPEYLLHLKLMYGSGLRLSELIRLRLGEGLPPIPSATLLPLICFSRVTTSGRFRNCWGTTRSPLP